MSVKLTQDEVLASGSIIHWGERESGERYRAPVTCAICGRKRVTTVQRGRSHGSKRDWSGCCSRCVNRGSRHGMWKGGMYVDADGYIYVHLASLSEEDRKLAEPMKIHTGYVLEHRLVLARKIGRPLTKNEVCHHLNGRTSDNRPENLHVTGRREHKLEHLQETHRLKLEVARLQRLLAEKSTRGTNSVIQ